MCKLGLFTTFTGPVLTISPSLCQAVATGGEKTGDPEILGSGTVFESQMFSGHTGLPGLPRSVLDQSIDVMLCPVLRGGHLQKGKCKKDNALGRV